MESTKCIWNDVYGLKPLIVIPMILILFREVFVSGLREFLGKDAGRLAVTKVAKWKTRNG